MSPKDDKIIQQYCSQHKRFIQLSPEQQKQFILAAIAIGKETAQNYRHLSLPNLISRFKIAIQYSEQNYRVGNMELRAKYSGNPPTITIYRKTLQQLLKTKRLSLTIQQLEEIALAHELYHHINLYKVQSSKSKVQINEPRKMIPKLFDELTAQSFTQHYLELLFFPLMIDFTECTNDKANRKVR